METTSKIKRSPLWDKINSEVKQIPREKVGGDSVDHQSLSTNLENLFKSEMVAFKKWYDSLSPSEQCTVWSKDGSANGLFTMADEALVNKFINIK